MGIKVMVVDDEPNMADIISSYLTALGCSVIGCASSGAEALNLASKALPDLAVMDIRLGGSEDGISVARELLGKWNIHVIYLTAYADEVTVARAEETKPYGYIMKPFGREEMGAALKIAAQISAYDKKLKEAERKSKEEAEKLERYRQSVLKSHFDFIPRKRDRLVGNIVSSLMDKDSRVGGV
jgi:DNA-binding NarL/FixJ family response regulator